MAEAYQYAAAFDGKCSSKYRIYEVERGSLVLVCLNVQCYSVCVRFGSNSVAENIRLTRAFAVGWYIMFEEVVAHNSI
jgi:hypothetical protein